MQPTETGTPRVINISPETIERNVKSSLRYPQFRLGGESGAVVICAAGYSTILNIKLVTALYKAGVPICAIKGVGQYLLRLGIVPKYVVSMDGKVDQARHFIDPHPDVEYLMAGQTDPLVLEELEKENAKITVWHGEGKEHLPEGTEYVLGGSTTALRAISLMWAKGYTVHHLVGFDCCELDGETHIYPTTEKQIRKLQWWRMGERRFRATPNMVAQYQEFMWHFGTDRKIQMTIHGNGMLAEAWARVTTPARAHETLDVVAETGPAVLPPITFPAPVSTPAQL